MKTPFKVSNKPAFLLGAVTTVHKTRETALKKARKIKGIAYQHNPFCPRPDHTDEMGVWEIIK